MAEKRLIDADRLWHCRPQLKKLNDPRYTAGFNECMAGFSEIIRKLIDNQPTADVVEVVRCCDCKHSEMVVDIIGDPHLFCKMHGNVPVGFDDYCSRAKRKEQT